LIDAVTASLALDAFQLPALPSESLLAPDVREASSSVSYDLDGDFGENQFGAGKLLLRIQG